MTTNAAKLDSGNTRPIWTQNSDIPVYEKLSGSFEVDVCIIGAGIAGLSCAYFLLKEGKSVAILEDHAIGSGETGRTSAELSCTMDDGFQTLEKEFGEEGARLAVQSHRQAIDTIESIAKKEGINCNFSRLDSYLFNEPGHKHLDLEKELEAARRAGLDKASKVSGLPL